MKGKIFMKKINSLCIATLLMLVGCGGSSSTSSSVDGTTQTSFQNKELYSFKLNFVDQRQRYDLIEVDGIDDSLKTKYFDFDSNDYEVDSKEQALFINGKRSALADATYTLDKNGSLEATVDGQKMFRLSLLEEKEVDASRLEEYGSDIKITGKVYESRLGYFSNVHMVKDLVTEEAFDNLEAFVTAYKEKTFAGSSLNGLVFSQNNEVNQQIESNVTKAGIYEIKTVDNKEILFLTPTNIQRYGSNTCYILDFSHVWKSECHLKDSTESLRFYDKDVYDDVLKYMQTAFVDVEISI
jgi:hypothetical protein